LSTGDFERWLKGALENERLSLKRLTAEGLEGGPLYWGQKEGSGDEHLSSWGFSWATWSGVVYRGL